MDLSELEKKLHETFLLEAKERIEALYSGLSELEEVLADDEKAKVIERIFREAHSLKGAARSVEVRPVENLSQAMESLFAEMKSNHSSISQDSIDKVRSAVMLIEKYINAGEDEKAGLEKIMEDTALTISDSTASSGPSRPGDKAATSRPSEKQAVCSAADADMIDEEQVCAPQPSSVCKLPQDFDSATVRIHAARLDTLLRKAEEFVTIKQVTQQRLAAFKRLREEINSELNEWERIAPVLELIKKEEEKTGRYAGISSFLDKLLERRKKNASELTGKIRTMERENRTIASLVDDFLYDIKETTLMPFSGLFAILPRMVRELASSLGKSVKLVIEGQDIEIDKRIQERLKDPLIHLVRNAVDHGIEPPEVRKKQNKNPKGTIKISVTQIATNRVTLTVADDGAGIPAERLIEKAVEMGVIPQEDASKLSDEEALFLVFNSGISTSPLITDISGRGLGMAIVKEAVEGIGGNVSVRSQPGKGTTFILQIPMTLATFRGIIVESSGQTYILPTASTDKILYIPEESIHTVKNREVVAVEGSHIPLVRLSQVLQTADTRKDQGSRQVVFAVVMGSGDERIGFVVDAVKNEQEVLVKPLGTQLARVNNIAGATMLATGELVLVLNSVDLVMNARKLITGGTLKAIRQKESTIVEKKILVVEDSFTSRTLLKNILEAAGYKVRTATDGREGLRMVKSEPFDAVVTDIEMPNMNGFELTEKIKADSQLEELPVILVTSLDSQADKERGIHAGADAYIVKSSFDQSNLLATLERLI